MIRASSKEAEMGRRARVERTPEQKLEIVLEGLKSGNIAETCRWYEVAPNLYCRWKDEALRGASAALGGRSAAAVENEKDRLIRQLEHSLWWKALEIEILKNVVGE
jgi:transposase-like protein